MATVKFKVGCMAVYKSELEVPNNIATNEEAVLDYIRNHLPDCNVGELEWIEDLEPYAAVTAEDIYDIGVRVAQARAINIEWSMDELSVESLGMPETVIIPDEYVADFDEDAISNWLSDEYGFCHEGFNLVFVTEEELQAEEKKLKKAIFDAGADAIEDFLGHPLDSDDIDIESEMNDALAQMPDKEYVKLLVKYCNY